MLILLGKKSLTTHLLSAQVNVLVFLTVGRVALPSRGQQRELSRSVRGGLMLL